VLSASHARFLMFAQAGRPGAGNYFRPAQAGFKPGSLKSPDQGLSNGMLVDHWGCWRKNGRESWNS
jgi:hypothetical protein